MADDRPVVVVAGAGAGAARSIAERFGKERWRTALISRSRERLEAACADIEASGGEALAFPCDVADCEAVFRVRDEVLQRWGRIDAWVNAAMVTVVGPAWTITPAEFRRVTEVTYLGYVHGTLAALEPMRRADRGAIVQAGSALAYRAIPLQSAYCACKFAIRGFTDSLRTELKHEQSKITLTMLQLPGMNTPQFDWARNKLAQEYEPVGDVFEPEVAGEAAWRAVKDGPRELWVGASAVQAISGQMFAPAVFDQVMATKGWDQQISKTPNPHRPDNLFEPAPGLAGARGRFGAEAKPRALIVDPDRASIGAAAGAAAAAVGAAGAAVAAAALAGRRRA
jgi:short-subunit dehydrogenase